MKHRRDTIGRNGWAPEGFKLPRCLMSCGASIAPATESIGCRNGGAAHTCAPKVRQYCPRDARSEKSR
jgi:hypothetical protein